MVRWLVDWLVGLRVVGWLVGWLDGWLVGRLVCHLQLLVLVARVWRATVTIDVTINIDQLLLCVVMF